ncbi:MAG TPA: zinc-binding dehydrogenase [Acidimicrobiales bacterium]|nr:zinc-binding dehydrogenase [Acidimicrobiales bacterium]
MRAATIVEGEIVVAERPPPEPGTGEVLVRVFAAGLNGADLMQRQGFYPPPPGVPADIPGLEIAGEVVAAGPGVTRLSLGDRVMAVVAGAGQAELAVVHERLAMPVPVSIDWPEAGGFPEVFTTAHDALFTQCGLQMGERVCVHGAAGGVGTAAVQLAAAAGAWVTATVRNEELRDAVAALGSEAGWTSVVAPGAFVEHGPYDVILELVGAPNLAANLATLDTWGRISIIGVGAGARAEIDLSALMRSRGAIRGSTLRTRSLEEKADAARRVERHVLPLLDAGDVRVPVAETFPLAEAAAAYDRFAAGGKLGKIVLTMD